MLLRFLIAVRELYNTFVSVSTSKTFADIIFPNNSISQEALLFTVNTATLFHYFFCDCIFCIEFATNTLLYNSENQLSSVFLDPINIFQQSAPNMLQKYYYVFILQLTPSPGYRPLLEPNSGMGPLDNQYILSRLSSISSNFLCLSIHSMGLPISSRSTFALESSPMTSSLSQEISLGTSIAVGTLFSFKNRGLNRITSPQSLLFCITILWLMSISGL